MLRVSTSSDAKSHRKFSCDDMVDMKNKPASPGHSRWRPSMGWNCKSTQGGLQARDEISTHRRPQGLLDRGRAESDRREVGVARSSRDRPRPASFRRYRLQHGRTARHSRRAAEVAEAAEIVRRQLYQARPARYEYHLAEAGEQLFAVLHAIRGWGDRFLRDDPENIVAFRHCCGAELHVEMRCAACGEWWLPEASRASEMCAGRILSALKLDRAYRLLGGHDMWRGKPEESVAP